MSYCCAPDLDECELASAMSLLRASTGTCCIGCQRVQRMRIENTDFPAKIHGNEKSHEE